MRLRTVTHPPVHHSLFPPSEEVPVSNPTGPDKPFGFPEWGRYVTVDPSPDPRHDAQPSASLTGSFDSYAQQ